MEEKYGIHFTEEILTAPGFGPLTREVVDTVQSVLDMNDRWASPPVTIRIGCPLSAPAASLWRCWATSGSAWGRSRAKAGGHHLHHPALSL